MKISPAYLSSLIGGANITTIQKIDLSGKDIEELEDISECVEVKKLNLSKNKLSTLQSIIDNTELTWLNASENKLTNLKGVNKLSKLNVLNLSQNSIESIEIGLLSHLNQLKALILNDNQIRRMEGFGGLTSLNTLVLSKNKIEDIEGYQNLKNLKKLSLSHNKIKAIPNMKELFELSELKLNKNLIFKVPKTISLNPNLKIVDLGNNLLREFSDIDPLSSLPKLNNLNLRGCPVASKHGYKEYILKLIPRLKIIDGELLKKIKKDNSSPQKRKETDQIDNSEVEIALKKKRKKKKKRF